MGQDERFGAKGLIILLSATLALFGSGPFPIGLFEMASIAIGSGQRLEYLPQAGAFNSYLYCYNIRSIPFLGLLGHINDTDQMDAWKGLGSRDPWGRWFLDRANRHQIRQSLCTLSMRQTGRSCGPTGSWSLLARR